MIVDKEKTHADTHTTNHQHFTVHRNKLTTDSNDTETFVIMLKLFAKVNDGKNIYPIINAPTAEIKKLWETAIQEAVKQNIYTENDISQFTINVKEPTTKPSYNP